MYNQWSSSCAVHVVQILTTRTNCLITLCSKILKVHDFVQHMNWPNVVHLRLAGLGYGVLDRVNFAIRDLLPDNCSLVDNALYLSPNWLGFDPAIENARPIKKCHVVRGSVTREPNKKFVKLIPKVYEVRSGKCIEIPRFSFIATHKKLDWDFLTLWQYWCKKVLINAP